MVISSLEVEKGDCICECIYCIICNDSDHRGKVRDNI